MKQRFAGRDIFYDQKSKYGIMLRKTLEAIYRSYKGDKSNADWKKFENIAVAFGLAMAIIIITVMRNFFLHVLLNIFRRCKASDSSRLPKIPVKDVSAFLNRIKPIIYDLKVEPKLVDLGPILIM